MNINEYESKFHGVNLPAAFCWTRVGSEAGQPLSSILKRKEAERTLNGGIFFWGIGNAIGPSLRELLNSYPEPEVIFSPIKSAPKKLDADPHRVAFWTRAEDLDGNAYDLPRHALITSRYSAAGRVPVHYALVCSAVAPLVPAHEPTTFDIADIENFATGRPVGASQVTAVVRHRKPRKDSSREYAVMLQAKMAWPFFLILRDPVVLPRSDPQSWESIVTDVWADILRRRSRRNAVNDLTP